LAVAGGDESRCHELTQQGGTDGRRAIGCRHGIGGDHRGVKDDVRTGSTVEGVLPSIADQDVVACAAAQRVVALAAAQDVAADQRIVAVAAGDRVVAGPAVERELDQDDALTAALGPWLTATTGKLDQQQLLALHTCLEAPGADVRVVVPARRRYRAKV
jgi:hypothetical protein